MVQHVVHYGIFTHPESTLEQAAANKIKSLAGRWAANKSQKGLAMFPRLVLVPPALWGTPGDLDGSRNIYRRPKASLLVARWQHCGLGLM